MTLSLSTGKNLHLTAAAQENNPQINPSDFTTRITNRYFSLPAGKKMIYETQTGDGLEHIEILVTGKTKKVMGVNTLVYWDRMWVDKELVEDTRDYLAQDKAGNVWYFGEDVDNFENGKLVDHAGSWLAGTDGAKPGIWMKASPKAGDTYRQEYYAGTAEDMVDVLSVSETVTVRGMKYTGCLKTYDYTPLDPDSKEYKYYCSQAGGNVLTENLTTGNKAELIKVNKVSTSGKPNVNDSQSAVNGTANNTTNNGAVDSKKMSIFQRILSLIQKAM